MLADPQSITVSGSASSLPRTSAGDNTAVYTAADGNTQMTIKHTYTSKNRLRTLIRFGFRKISASPLITGTSIQYDDSISITINRDLTGYSPADVVAQMTGIVGLISASSYAFTTAVGAGQS
jgi:hypothetical protein